jgi:8-oxo-dGTP diphosphatase
MQNHVMQNASPAASPSPLVGAGAVIWNDRRELVLIRRGKPPRQDQWSIPGGHVEWGESVREAVLREVHEETGLSVEIAGLIDVVDLVTRDETGNVSSHFVLIDFAARFVSGALHPGSDAADARWVAYSLLDDYPLWSETRRIIDASRRLLDNAGAKLSR